MEDFIARIRAGEFQTKLDYPTRYTHPDRAERLAAVKAYRENQDYLERCYFKAELLTYLHISDHPKADLLFAKAWDRGHSSGLEEVAFEADDLVELLG